MNVLVNRHHADLYFSFHLLAKRLGWNLYIPAGMEWFDQGYFLMHMHPEKEDPLRYMAEWFLVRDLYPNGDTKHRFMGCREYPKVKPLTLEEANDIDFDIIISTNRENDQPFEKYRNEHHPKAKLVRQMGNRHDRTHYPNVMSSDMESYEAAEGHKIIYHQEFDLSIFEHKEIIFTNNIYSFQHNLEKYEPAEKLWDQHRRTYTDYDFQFFGKGNDGGYIYSKRRYIALMRTATFVWQVKDWDGYSHVIHNAMALGRPMILRREDIKGKIFEPLCDETTCIFTDQMDRLGKVDPQEMGYACLNRFYNLIDFNHEEKLLRQFFEDLR